MAEELTDKRYWEGTYNGRKRQPPLSIEGFKNYSNRMLFSKLLETTLEGKRILEIGAGDSAWLPYLAKQFPTSEFVGVDYTEIGCNLLRERAQRMKVAIEVVQEDMFSEDSPLHGTFDTVVSFGVVEHFQDLGKVLSTIKRYLKRNGLLFTVVPNMAGVLGTLTRVWNTAVYRKHNPHDWDAFSFGHRQAGLEIISGGYLCSNNFAVLSGCFDKKMGLSWHMCRALVGVTLAIWSVENVLGSLPTSRAFSPYIYATSRITDGFR